MDNKSLKNLSDGFRYALIGIMLYPVPVFLAHLFSGYFIDIINSDLSYSSIIKSVLIITPSFSFFFFLAVMKLTGVDIGIKYEKQIQRIFRVVMFCYVLMAVVISLSALFSNTYLLNLTEDFKTVLWRVGGIFSFIYIAFVYFELNELEWGIITLGFLAISLFEDIYYYLLRIEALTEKLNSYTIDETLLLMSAIVLFGTMFLIANLVYKLNRAIKRNPD